MFEQSPLGSEFEKQTDFTENQCKMLDTNYEFDRLQKEN